MAMDNGARTVLVVDDDPQILRLLETMLKPRRVKVLVTPQATEALWICEREAVHLLISDVRMPEMDGRKLAERVLKLHPQASVLLISGHATEAEAAGDETGRVRFLRKPFFPAELVKLVRELLLAGM